MDETRRARAWVATEAEADERREHARQLVGLVPRGVRYVTLDYRRWDRARNTKGPRRITDASEWQQPTWQYDDCDSVDFGVELTTTDDRVFSVTWDAPFDKESIGLRETPLLGSRFGAEGDFALWDVADRSRWSTFVGTPMRSVELHYLPWADEGLWCTRITFTFDSGSIELLLGEGCDGGPVGPASDNVAVLFRPEKLPVWEQSEVPL